MKHYTVNWTTDLKGGDFVIVDGEWAEIYNITDDSGIQTSRGWICGSTLYKQQPNPDIKKPMKELDYPFNCGDISTVAKDAIAFAQNHIARDGQPVKVRFVFNDLEITAYSSSSYLDIADKYNLQSQLRRARLGYKD